MTAPVVIPVAFHILTVIAAIWTYALVAAILDQFLFCAWNKTERIALNVRHLRKYRRFYTFACALWPVFLLPLIFVITWEFSWGSTWLELKYYLREKKR